jgi:hypothetical protein
MITIQISALIIFATHIFIVGALVGWAVTEEN